MQTLPKPMPLHAAGVDDVIHIYIYISLYQYYWHCIDMNISIDANTSGSFTCINVAYINNTGNIHIYLHWYEYSLQKRMSLVMVILT